jgi:hypothetical protein
MARYEIKNHRGEKLGIVNAKSHRRALDALAKRHGFRNELHRVSTGAPPFNGTVQELRAKPKKKAKAKAQQAPFQRDEHGFMRLVPKKPKHAKPKHTKPKKKPKAAKKPKHAKPKGKTKRPRTEAQKAATLRMLAANKKKKK